MRHRSWSKMPQQCPNPITKLARRGTPNSRVEYPREDIVGEGSMDFSPVLCERSGILLDSTHYEQLFNSTAFIYHIILWLVEVATQIR